MRIVSRLIRVLFLSAWACQGTAILFSAPAEPIDVETQKHRPQQALFICF